MDKQLSDVIKAIVDLTVWPDDDCDTITISWHEWIKFITKLSSMLDEQSDMEVNDG